MIPEYIRSLIVILFIGSAVLFYIRPLSVSLGYQRDFYSLSMSWYVVHIIAFVSGNYWVFLIITAIYLRTIKPVKIENAWLVFITLSLMLPALPKIIPGFLGINYFGLINWYRFLVIVLFVPIFLNSISAKKIELFDYFSDKLVIIYFLLIVIIEITRLASVTDILRNAMYHLVDIVIPYYMVSRGIRNVDDIKRAFFILFVISCVAACISCVEIIKSWHLYDSLLHSLDIIRAENVTNYKFRSGYLRAGAAYGPIALAYILTLGFLVTYYIFSKTKDLRVKVLLLFMVVGILASLSRGPWVAFLVSLFVLFFLERKVIKYTIFMALSLIILVLSPVGDKFVLLLPFVGDDVGGTVSYRQDLFLTSLEVIREHPLFGSNMFLDNPKMQHLIQGEGIIDIVNTFLQVALEYGVVTLIVFVCILVFPMLKLYTLAKKFGYPSQKRSLCHVLIALMVATLITIMTVSSLGSGIVSFLTWILVAVMSAYIRILAVSTKNIVSDKRPGVVL